VDLLARLLRQHRIGVSAFGSGAGKAVCGLHLTSLDAALRVKACDFIARLIDVAACFGAPVIIGSMQGSLEKGVTHSQALGWLSEALNELGERAKTRGVKLIFEPLNPLWRGTCLRLPKSSPSCMLSGINSTTKRQAMLCHSCAGTSIHLDDTIST
jgi:sugar phosphate isomerase/epimerase